MKSNPNIYRTAQGLIDQYGSLAEEHVYRLMLCCLDIDDPKGAGIWLVVGDAIEKLQTLPPAGTLH